MANTLVITGVAEIQQAFDLLPRNLARKVIRREVRKGMAVIRDAAKKAAPLGETGQLKKAIKLRAAVSRRRGEIALEVRIGEGDFKGKSFYGAFVEYGTSKQPAQSFMRRTFDSYRDRVTRMVTMGLRRAIEGELKALAKKGGGKRAAMAAAASAGPGAVVIRTGSRGGRFKVTAGGHKSYLKRRK